MFGTLSLSVIYITRSNIRDVIVYDASEKALANIRSIPSALIQFGLASWGYV
jgi:hypothetical protein